MGDLRADTELRYLPGVGPKRAEALAELGYATVEDLLQYLPFRWDDRRRFARIADLRSGGPPATVPVVVESARVIRTRRRGFSIFRAVVRDADAAVEVLAYNQPYLERVFTPGRPLLLYGSLGLDRSGKPVLENPEVEAADDGDGEGIHAGRIVPVYRKLGPLTPRMLRRLVHGALESLAPGAIADRVPQPVRRRHRLPAREDALREAHFPGDATDVRRLAERDTPALRALAFEEIYLLQLALALRRHGLQQETRGIAYEVPDALRTRLARLLPFKLTGAQKRVLKEIGADLRAPHPMHRLLQGDVGSGKTIVAFLTMLVAVENGRQAALMAPTEILAAQHLRALERLFADAGETQPATVFLSGSRTGARRRAARERVASGEARLVVGTHALFEAGVDFRSLGLVVVDEQHRFGVLQRAALAAKGEHPDVLVMTATPIPRSLSMTLYGDLDVSVIDEKPPGREPVRTVVRAEADRERVYRGLAREVARGRQAYVVVPLAEETERSDLKDARAFSEHLRRDVFPDVGVGMVHGKMKPAEKDAVMRAFAAGELRILVATTVIEVGVDVPNAGVMLVEHAERFGLSQLHQLRGRVGRGGGVSYCVLMAGESGAGEEARRRLETLAETDDGFRIAETDLELRGPGAVFGTQQHGLSDLQFLREALRDPGLIESARREAQQRIAAGKAEREEALATLRSLGGTWQRRLDLARSG